MSNFKELGLSDKILEVLDQIGFENPTPIQEQSIPILLDDDRHDFIGLAQTGTGKTAAFGLPLLDLIDESDSKIQGLIMAPTRELGQQIAQQLNEFAQNNPKLRIEVVYGGAPITKQIKALKKSVQIVVATPGRLLDLIRRKSIKLHDVEYVVLDEADEMLNMGFKEDIDAILEHAGDNPAIWLFSATMPSSIRRIIKKFMDEPKEVKVNTKEISNKDITHQYVITKSSDKLTAIRRFLDIQPNLKGVLFCRTKRDTEQIAEQLSSIGYNVAALNGDMSQGQRDKVMKLFKNKSMKLLVATDVAARGIDVKELTHVMHHSLPDQMEYYTHRSGRTGRAGNKGISLVFINSRDKRRIKDLEKRIKISFEQVTVPTHKETLGIRLDNWVEEIMEVRAHKTAEELSLKPIEQLASLTKEDLIKRLISIQLQGSASDKDYFKDLNERFDTDGKSGRRKTKDHSGREKEDTHRYFINVGKMDGVSAKELVEFLVDVSGLNSKYFSEISLQNSCAYFNVDKKHDKGFGAKFEGIEIANRSIRVNRDSVDNKPKKGKKMFSGYKKGSSGKYKSKRNAKPGKKSKSKKRY